MKLKKPSLKYLQKITDDFGVWQHSSKGIITKSEGYALDDSARALIVYLLYGDQQGAEVCLKYLEKSYLDGKFHGFFDENRLSVVYPSSEDAFNLGVIALAFCISKDFHKERAMAIINQLELKPSEYIRSLAYRLIAESYLQHKEIADDILNKVIGRFNKDIKWFEENLYYANAAIPYSLLIYLNVLGIKNQKVEGIVLQSIDTLEKNMRIGLIPSPVSNSMNHKVGSRIRDVYGQQPIEAAFMVLMYIEANKYFNKSDYLVKAKEWMDWFYGDNIWKKSIVTDEGACADGLDELQISQNSGAESTIMYLWAGFYNGL